MLPTGPIQGGSHNPTVVHGSVIPSTQTTQVSLSHAMPIVHSHTEGNYTTGLPNITTQINYPPQPGGGMPTAALPNQGTMPLLYPPMMGGINPVSNVVPTARNMGYATLPFPTSMALHASNNAPLPSIQSPGISSKVPANPNQNVIVSNHNQPNEVAGNRNIHMKIIQGIDQVINRDYSRDMSRER